MHKMPKLLPAMCGCIIKRTLFSFCVHRQIMKELHVDHVRITCIFMYTEPNEPENNLSTR